MTIPQIYIRGVATDRSRLQFVELGGVRVGLLFRHTGHTDRWDLWIYDTAGTRLFGPLRCVPGLDMFGQFRHDPRVPQGQLFVSSPGRIPPTKDTADTTAIVLFRPL